MSVQHSILANNNFISIYNLLPKGELHLKLDPSYGWEKLVTADGEEFFDLMQTSVHIHRLSRRNLKELDPSEIEQGEKVCKVFRSFWYQLAKELGELDCLTSTFYRGTHVKRYVTIISDMNQEWLDLWQGEHPDVMLRPSWYIFNALSGLRTAHKNQ